MPRKIVIHNHYARDGQGNLAVERIVRAYKSKTITRERAVRLLEEQGASAKELDNARDANYNVTPALAKAYSDSELSKAHQMFSHLQRGGPESMGSQAAQIRSSMQALQAEVVRREKDPKSKLYLGRDAKDGQWYKVGRTNGYEIFEGAGVNGGQWAVKLGARMIVRNSRAEADRFAENQPEKEGKRDRLARDSGGALEYFKVLKSGNGMQLVEGQRGDVGKWAVKGPGGWESFASRARAEKEYNDLRSDYGG